MSFPPACNYDTVSCFQISAPGMSEEASNVAITHNINRTVQADIKGYSVQVFSCQRSFKLHGDASMRLPGQGGVYGVPNAIDENNPQGIVDCAGGGTITNANSSASVSEDCVISSCKFHYINIDAGVAFFERITDTLRFSVTTHSRAAFRTRWGTFWSHEFWIPKTTVATRKKDFIYMKQGTERILSSQSSTFSVLPSTTGAIATGGLGGTDINQADLEAAKNANVSNIGLILCVPQPPGESTATEIDPEILAKGFYDYTMMGEQLGQLDGGKDFFYPEWCRNMTPDPYWAYEAQARWDFTYHHLPLPNGNSIKPELQWELAPQCSYANHPVHGEMWSWVFMDGAGKGQSFCEHNGEPVDPILAEAIKPDHTLSELTAYTPISLY